jgi:hypothetical protein
VPVRRRVYYRSVGHAEPVGPERPEEVARAFHDTLLEVLRRLNQSSERRGEVDGLELPEIERALHRYWAHRPDETNLSRAMRLLLENGLVAHESAPRYAWDRRRTLRDRYLITPLGKAYLLRSVIDSGRIA